MDGMFPGIGESDACSVSNNLPDDEVIPRYFSREEIERNSPSRRDGIDLKKETCLRKSYCAFLKDLGERLKVSQRTIATAIVFCHRFFIRQSHAKNDSLKIATVCMLIAGKVEETPRDLKDIVIFSQEIIHNKKLDADQRKGVYEQQKELVLSGEELVLSTLNFDLTVRHPYKPLAHAIQKYKVAEAKAQFCKVAESFVNDCLRTSLYLQYKPQHIAAGVFFLAAKHLEMDLQAYQEGLYQEFNITASQLEDIHGQMLELGDDDEVIPWYFSREKIERNSPSRRDGIDLKKETSLRKSYCKFLKNLGVRLKVPQRTIATAIVLCHRFFIRQSHVKNGSLNIATVCMLLAGKVEETPRALKDVIVVSYEIIYKTELDATQRKKVYDEHKELVLSGEELVLCTLNFDLIVHHPHKPLVEAIKKYKVAEAKAEFSEVAWNFVNDSLWTSLCLQYKPHQIAAGGFFLAAEHLAVDLKSYEESLYKEFDVTPSQLKDIRGQMLELYKKKDIPTSQGNIIESSDLVHQTVSESEARQTQDDHSITVETSDDTVKAIGDKALKSFDKGIKKRELMEENALTEGEVEDVELHDEDGKRMQKRSQSFLKVEDSDNKTSVEEPSKMLDANQAGVGGKLMADASLMNENDLKEMDIEDGEIVD